MGTTRVDPWRRPHSSWRGSNGSSDAVGFKALPAGLDILYNEYLQQLPPGPIRRARFAEIFADGLAGPMLADLLTIIPARHPDLIVHEVAELGGLTAGEILKIPHLVHNLIAWDRDHVISADRLSGLGVTRILRVPEVNRESVSAGVQALLTDPAYRQRVIAIRADIAPMRSPAEVARVLVDRVSEWSAA